MTNWIKLLSPKGFDAYDPESFRAYVRSLYYKKERKTPKIRLKKVKPPLVWSKTAHGRLSVRVNRNPKWITESEYKELYTAVMALGFTPKQLAQKTKKIEVREE